MCSTLARRRVVLGNLPATTFLRRRLRLWVGARRNVARSELILLGLVTGLVRVHLHWRIGYLEVFVERRAEPSCSAPREVRSTLFTEKRNLRAAAAGAGAAAGGGGGDGGEDGGGDGGGSRGGGGGGCGGSLRQHTRREAVSMCTMGPGRACVACVQESERAPFSTRGGCSRRAEARAPWGWKPTDLRRCRRPGPMSGA